MIDDSIINEIEVEKLSARNKYGVFKSKHEAYAVILEELDEFWESIKKKEDQQKTRKELIQVTTACIMALEDLFA
ncbi:MAG: hypothetical protein ACYDAO_03365 [Thermoplasmataceae archaeon]